MYIVIPLLQTTGTNRLLHRLYGIWGVGTTTTLQCVYIIQCAPTDGMSSVSHGVCVCVNSGRKLSIFPANERQQAQNYCPGIAGLSKDWGQSNTTQHETWDNFFQRKSCTQVGSNPYASYILDVMLFHVHGNHGGARQVNAPSVYCVDCKRW